MNEWNEIRWHTLLWWRDVKFCHWNWIDKTVESKQKKPNRQSHTLEFSLFLNSQQTKN